MHTNRAEYRILISNANFRRYYAADRFDTALEAAEELAGRGYRGPSMTGIFIHEWHEEETAVVQVATEVCPGEKDWVAVEDAEAFA